MKSKEEHEFGLFLEGSKVSVANYYLHLNRYRFASDFVKDKLCLDVGCGTGYGSAYLVRKGAKNVTGGDKSEDAISCARSAAETESREALEFRILEATSLPFADSSFDVAVSFEVIEHLKDYERFLSEIRRVLRRGGRLILSTPNRQAGPFCFKTRWKCHAHEFSKRELLDLVNKHFGNTEIYGQFLLDRRSCILTRVRQTVGRLLEVMGLRSLATWLGRLLFKHNRLIVYKTKDFDNLTDKKGEVVPLAGGLTPGTFVVVATKT